MNIGFIQLNWVILKNGNKDIYHQLAKCFPTSYFSKSVHNFVDANITTFKETKTEQN
jgi:hypothetical protein